MCNKKFSLSKNPQKIRIVTGNLSMPLWNWSKSGVNPITTCNKTRVSGIVEATRGKSFRREGRRLRISAKSGVCNILELMWTDFRILYKVHGTYLYTLLSTNIVQVHKSSGWNPPRFDLPLDWSFCSSSACTFFAAFCAAAFLSFSSEKGEPSPGGGNQVISPLFAASNLFFWPASPALPSTPAITWIHRKLHRISIASNYPQTNGWRLTCHRSPELDKWPK